jgi:hypothetical protein
MSAGKMVFDVDEARRLQAKISQVSEDTNRLYLQLKGQASQWDGLPLGTGRWQAQVLINELTVEAEKLEDLIRMAVKGVQDVQDESKRQASQISQQFSIFGGMFGNFGAGFGSAGRSPIPAFAQKISTNLISSIAILSGKDILNSDPMVRKLLDMIKQSGLGTVDSIAAQSKLKDIYEARDQIAKAQTAFVVYQAFGNQAQMDRVHQLAEEARAKLKSFGVDEAPYQAGKDLSVYFKQPAVQACEYDPSITSGKVPLVQNEAYQLLLRMAMEQGKQGDWAKGQLEGIHATMKQMIAAGVNLGVHMMTNQGAEAWGDVARLTSSFAQLESYNLFKSKAPDEQAGTPEKSKNAFLKSLDSFKEIGTGFVNTLRIRADKATDSPYDFVNWITLGIAGDLPVGIYKEAKARADHMLDSPEKFADWLTLGTVEMGKGAFHPEESWSAEHWLNSLGIASLLVGPLEKSLLSTGGKLPKPMISKDVADNGMDILSKEKGGQVVEGTGNSLDSVPSVRNGEFNKWFNSLTPDEFDKVWADPKLRNTIKDRLRHPGGLHEWHLVSKADVFKRWGVTSEQIAEMRTLISETKFVNPKGKHGGKGSTTAHNELLDIIDSSTDYDMFKRRLQNWANYRFDGGVDALPNGLKP